MKKIINVLAVTFYSLAILTLGLLVFRSWVKPLIEQEKAWRETVYRRSKVALETAAQTRTALETQGTLQAAPRRVH